MASRMDKYYKSPDVDETVERSRKNENLYREMYDTTEYSNVEGIAKIEKTNEVDLEKIKELLNQKEENPRPSRTMKEETPLEVNFEEEERNYDIRDILNKAKEERLEDTRDYRKLNNTEYDILANVEVKEETVDLVDDDEELKELINTLTSNTMLKDINDVDLSLGLLNDLKSDTETLTSTIDQGANIEALEKTLTGELSVTSMDKSFYTRSMDLSEEDFTEMDDLDKKLKKNGILIKVLIVILILVILAAVFFVVKNYVL